MKALLNRILFFICLASTSLSTTCVVDYYLKEPMAVELINRNLGGYEFILWLIYIPNLIALYFTLKEIINENTNK
jgi:hypothetical protein